MGQTAMDRLEYHRHAAALVPAAQTPDPGVAMREDGAEKGLPTLTCNCRSFAKSGACRHIQELEALVKDLEAGGAAGLDVSFRQSPWYRLAACLHEIERVEPEDVAVHGAGPPAQEGAPESEPGGAEIRLEAQKGGWRLSYFTDHRAAADAGSESAILLERLDLAPAGEGLFHRGAILGRLSRMTLTESERVMEKKGYQTRRQALETGFWYRLAYHCFRVSQGGGAEFRAAGDPDTGDIALHCSSAGSPLFKLELSREKSRRLIGRLGGDLENPHAFRMVPDALEPVVWITADSGGSLLLTLYFRLHLPEGGTELIERKAVRTRWHQDAVYFPEKGFFATVRQPDPFREQFGGKYRKKIRRDRVPEALEKLGRDLFGPPNIVDESVREIRVHTEHQSIEIAPDAMERDWCWLSMRYGFGENANVSLFDLYAAKKTGKRFLPVSDGWVDVRAVDLEPLLGPPGSPFADRLQDPAGRLKLSRLDLFRLQAASERELRISGENREESERLSRMMELRPAASYCRPAAMASELRKYQERGVEWLYFLSENRFGGILCDEMGLGKTHQVMALMAWLTGEGEGAGPFLVVCPTSVLSHWRRKISEHAPGLSPVVYHGADRELEEMERPGRVLITSYGILLRDVEALGRFRFGIAAFDEAQHIKNPQTRSYRAAQAVSARMKLAVTGTPIENRLSELKALMDLCLPGYLGGDAEFAERYGASDGRGISAYRRAELNRLITPFTLRRRKASVLTELPEKIEDIRYCRLTEAQVRLYRQAVADRGRGLQQALENSDAEIPYIHIFALLTLLKQICDHPAIIDPERSGAGGMPLDSGKWEVFTELLADCLETGQKVVVYSQFVAMVRMIEKHIAESGVGAVSLTGATRKRGEVIDRFNHDPECRVFVGSLKAGGTGIDLTGGSVVIHYDRWWNAAKEDQATDRVHRIGQKRGVQVFKLVTEGTLEEKIAAVISRKKDLMAEVIQEDDPGVLKTFSRRELAELLADPGPGAAPG